jgi:hypothetical protein
MDNSFYFSCPCGRKTAVRTTQAGQPLRCECGAEHMLPSMLEIARFEPVASSDPPRLAARWTAREQLLFLGAVLLAAGLVLAGAIAWNWPPVPRPATPEQIRTKIQSQTLLETVREWGDLLRGLEARPRREDRDYQEAAVWSRRWLWIAAAMGAVGIATMAGGLLATRATRARAAQSR